MHVWRSLLYYKNLPPEIFRRTGIYFRFYPGVNPEVREEVLHFSKWLRNNYTFPIRIPVYIKKEFRLLTRDGDLAVGTFFEPFEYSVEPYIRIATGDYEDLKRRWGEKAALKSLACIA